MPCSAAKNRSTRTSSSGNHSCTDFIAKKTSAQAAAAKQQAEVESAPDWMPTEAGAGFESLKRIIGEAYGTKAKDVPVAATRAPKLTKKN